MILSWLIACSGLAILDVVEHPDTPLGALATVETESGCRAAVGFVSEGLPERFTRWTEPLTTARFVEVLGLRAERSWTLTAWQDCEGEWSSSESVSFDSGAVPFDLPAFDVEVFDPDGVQPGVTFIAPVVKGTQEPPVFVGLDEAGEIVWIYQDPDADTSHADPFLAVQADGSVLVAHHDTIQGLSWGGLEQWSVSGDAAGVGELHHDGVKLDDGSVLGLVAETRSLEVEGQVQDVVGDEIVQLSTDSKVLWRWSPFDHLDTSTLAEKDSADWIHANALLYREGVVVLSSRALDRLIAIDHGSGEVLWQLGDGGDFDLLGGRWFDGQHAPEWHDEDILVLYDNGLGRGTSRAVVYQLDRDARTLEQLWRWQTEAYTPRLGDADLLDNGNVLVTAGGPEGKDSPAIVSEVDSDGIVVWEVTLHDAALYRATRVDWPWLRPQAR